MNANTIDSVGGLLLLNGALVDRLMDRPDAAGYHPAETVRWVCTMVSRKGSARLLMRCTADLTVSVLTLDEVKTQSGFVPTLVSATGRDLTGLGPEILTSIGLRPSDLDDVADHFRGVTAAEKAAFSVTPPHASLLTSLFTWRDTAFPATLLLIHSTDPKGKAAARLASNAIPYFARPLIPVEVLGSDARAKVNALLSTPSLPAPVPQNGAAVLHRDPDGTITVLAREVMRDAAAGRRLGVALRTSLRRTASATASLQLPGFNDPDPADVVDESTAEEAARADAAEQEIVRLRALLEVRERDLRDARREAAALAAAVDGRGRASDVEAGGAPGRDEAEPAAEPAAEPGESSSLAAEPGPAPTTFRDLLAQARQTLPHLVVPEHLDHQVQALQSDPKSARWVERTWAIMLSLEAYASARTAGQPVWNLRDYLASADAPLIAERQVALGESTQVRLRSKYRDARTFPVSADVDLAGKAYFGAHVRVESSGHGLAPRLYFLDDLGGATQVIHLGYLGPHLVNTHTN